MKLPLKVASLLIAVIILQSCATNPQNNDVSNQTYRTTPSIQSNSYMYRSPPTNLMRTHGLIR